LRQLAYKLANLLVRGPAIVLAGVVGWRFGFIAMAALMAAILPLHLWPLPRTEARKRGIRELLAVSLRPRWLAALAAVAAVVVLERRFGWLAGALRNIEVPFVRKVPVEGWIGIGLVLGLIVVAIMMGFPTAFTLMGLGMIFGYVAFWIPDQHWWANRVFDLVVQRAYGVMIKGAAQLPAHLYEAEPVPYVYGSGTSPAAPHVSGVAALMLQAAKEAIPEVTGPLIPKAVKDALVGTAERIQRLPVLQSAARAVDAFVAALRPST
jgi:hypothetical protein